MSYIFFYESHSELIIVAKGPISIPKTVMSRIQKRTLQHHVNSSRSSPFSRTLPFHVTQIQEGGSIQQCVCVCTGKTESIKISSRLQMLSISERYLNIASHSFSSFQFLLSHIFSCLFNSRPLFSDIRSLFSIHSCRRNY